MAQLASSTPAYSPYTQTNYALYSQPTNNVEARLQQQATTLAQGFSALATENQHCYRVIDALMPVLQINALLNQEIEAMDKAIASLVPFTGMANVWMRDALAHEQVLDNVCHLISDPEYLVYWAFLVWNQSIRADGGAAIEWISDEFNKLLNTYEQRYLATSGGQHSQIWFQKSRTATPVMGSPDFQFTPAPTSIIPMPPVPGSNGVSASPVDQLKQRISLMKSGTPDLAQQMQRAHVQQRQMMGGGNTLWEV